METHAPDQNDQIILDAINTAKALVFALRNVVLCAHVEDPKIKDKVNQLLQVTVFVTNLMTNYIGMPNAKTSPKPDMDDPILVRLADVMAAMGDPDTNPRVLDLLDPANRRWMFERAAHVARATTNDEFTNWYLKAFSNESDKNSMETDPRGPARQEG